MTVNGAERRALPYRTGCLLTVLLTAAVLLTGCKHENQGKTENGAEALNFGGTITLDTPEIYTRERLVNDRFRQVAWLLRRLKDADEITFGVQGLSDSKSSDSLSGSLNFTVGSLLGGAAEDGSNPKAQNNEAPRSEEEQGGTRAGELSASPIDDFRDYLAYLEEVRNEIIETQLDDRHDLDGNTLYRLKFDATVIPGRDTNAWARIDVELFNPITRKSFEVLLARAGSIVTSPDNQASEPQIEGQALDEASTATELQDASPTEVMTSSQQQDSQYWQRIYAEWRKALENRVNAEIEEAVFRYDEETLSTRDEGEILRFIKRRYEGSLTDEEEESWPRSLPDGTSLKDFAHTLQELGFVDGRRRDQDLHFLIAASIVEDYDATDSFGRTRSNLQDYVRLELRAGDAAPEVRARNAFRQYTVMPTDFRETQTLVHEEMSCANPVFEFEFNGTSYKGCKNPLEGVISKHGLENAEVFSDTYDEFDYDLEKETGRDVRDTYLEINIGLQNFIDAVQKSGNRTYAYAVTPKEVAHRLESAAVRASDRALAAALGGGAATLSAKLETEWQHHINRRAKILDRRPMVVGLAQVHKDDSAHFGWLVGPRLVTDHDGEIRFRQVPARHTLSAIISVPAWWQQAQINISANWLDENGEPKGGSALEGGVAKVSNLIRLPGDLGTITDRLQGDTEGPGPKVFTAHMPQLLRLVAGQPAKILIPGRNLWRSTVVTIGAEKSSRITVLPNMEGIIAEFDSVPLPPDWTDTSKPYKTTKNQLPVIVWTSEGQAQIEQTFEFHMPQPAPQANPPSPVVSTSSPSAAAVK